MPAARSTGPLQQANSNRCTWRLGFSSSTNWINPQMKISHRAWLNAKMPSIGGLRIQGLHRNCTPMSDPFKVRWLLRHLGFSWLTLFESGELCIFHLNRVSPVSPVHVSVTSMWATAWIYQLEVVFGMVLNSVGCHNFPFINGYTIPFPSWNSILIRLSKTEFTDNLDRFSFYFTVRWFYQGIAATVMLTFMHHNIYILMYIYIYIVYIHTLCRCIYHS